MGFHIDRDYFDNPIVPDYVLCKANKDRIGTLKCTTKNITVKHNNIDEITFTTNLYNDGELNLYYDAATVMKYILLPDIGFFAISSVNINAEGTELETKTVTAKSYECLLSQKYLENFSINTGLTGSIDGVRFYNLGVPEKSLLNLILEKCPDWTIGYVDPILQTKERSFEISRQDVYSFMTTNISEAFGCIFEFDTLHNIINVYAEENVGQDTNIYVSFNNLLKKTNISSNTDNIKTCITLTGDEDLTVREINLGQEKIYNFDYYNSTEYWSQGLCDAYNLWQTKYNSQVEPYTALLSQYQNYYSQINELTYTKMPDDPESTDWTLYGLHPLQEKLSANEQKQSAMMKAGWGESTHANYTTQYLPVYNTIQAINKQIEIVNNEIDILKKKQDEIFAQMSVIMNDIDMKNNFISDQLKELSTFIREEELNSSNYVVTDTMTDEERFDMLNDMITYGRKKLGKVAVPQLAFSVDMVNLFAIPEFQIYNGTFDIGNYIHIALRDDFAVKTRLLEMNIDFYDVNNFSVSFGNLIKSGDQLYDVMDAINLATSAATSVSFNSSYWSQFSEETSKISQMINVGLLSAGKYLSSGDDSEMVIDSRGIFVNTTSGTYANMDSIFVGGGRILFTQDNWKTVSMSVGRADVTIKGITSSKFGTFADFVLAGYIGGTTIEGNEILGGTITGTVFNNGNGTFLVDENGNLTATSATIKGKIQADSGYIGGENGFTIVSQKLYSGKSAFNNSSAGVYIGTDGIALGANNAFSVDSVGNLIAKTGTIGGIKIDSSRIYSDNDNFQITSSGYGQFKDITITGVRTGSSFGGIEFSSKGTFGDFDYGFSAGHGFGLSGGALTDFNDLVVNKIDANYINTNLLNCQNFTAVQGVVNTISADYITSETLKAHSITADKLNAGKVNGNNVSWQLISYCYDVEVLTNNIDINGNTVHVVTGVTPRYNNLFSICSKD